MVLGVVGVVGGYWGCKLWFKLFRGWLELLILIIIFKLGCG